MTTETIEREIAHTRQEIARLREEAAESARKGLRMTARAQQGRLSYLVDRLEKLEARLDAAEF